MNWIDTVNTSIQKYPTLYLKKTWELSAFAVAHHIFIVLGNGYEWAETEDPTQGGYLTTPKSYRENDEWVRMIDPPYYETPTITLQDGVFDPKVKKYIVSEIYHEASEIVTYPASKHFYSSEESSLMRLCAEYELPSIEKTYGKVLILEGRKKYLTKYSKEKHSDYILMAESIDDISINSDRENPYPNFSKTYSPFWEIDPSLIKPDWREAGINHLKFWKKWFENPNNYEKYSYYPKKSDGDSIKGWLLEYEPDYFKMLRDTFVLKIQKDYNCPIFNGDNWDEMEEYIWVKHLKEVKTFIDETIDRLTL